MTEIQQVYTTIKDKWAIQITHE